MAAAQVLANDHIRVAALHSYDAIDTECEDVFDEPVRLAHRSA